MAPSESQIAYWNIIFMIKYVDARSACYVYADAKVAN